MSYLYPVTNSKLSFLPSLDKPVYYNKAAKLLKIVGVQPKQVPYSAKFWRGEILTDTDSLNIWWKKSWRLVTVFHYTPVNAKQFDGLNIRGLAGSIKNVKIPPPVTILCYMVV